MMRRTLITLGAGAAAVAATFCLPAAAQAATVAAAAVPAPHNSLYVAGYKQSGCHAPSYPLYVEISANIVVPAATDLNGPPGLSSDILNIGGLSSGVTAGVFVGSDAGQAYYHAFWNWEGTTTSGTAPFTVSAGDVLEVTIDLEGSEWLVQINDATTRQDYSQTFVGPITPSTFCQAGAYEQSPYPQPAITTQTSPIAFYDAKVRWDNNKITGYQTTKLLGNLPSGATLHRYTLVTTSGGTVAVTSKPTGNNNNFTITDS
jgi:Peptidase A4 family